MKLNFLSASFSEKKGVLILAYVLVLLLLIWLLFFQTEKEFSSTDDEQFKRLEKQLSLLTKSQNDTLFYFNPNTVTEAELKQLNVNPVAVKNWIEKRQKYAFHKPGDVLWVKGLSKYKYLQLQKYMVFEEENKEGKYQKNETYRYSYNTEKLKSTSNTVETTPFNLNTVTQKELEDLKIRSYIAERIVKFRESLGGFYSKNQLKDVYGIKDFELKILSTGHVNQNEIVSKDWSEQTFKALLSHPYIDYKLCQRIFNLKDSLKANEFSELEGFLAEESYQKISPYYN